MELEKAEKLVKALEETGEQATIRHRYSGRGMKDKETVAIATMASPAHVHFVYGQMLYFEEGGPTEVYELEVDNLGAGYIYY